MAEGTIEEPLDLIRLRHAASHALLLGMAIATRY
jgi:hypothetical protein